MIETQKKKNQPGEESEYHGPDRRKPENSEMRRAVEVRLIANCRQKEIDAKVEPDGAEKKKTSLLDW